MYKRQALACAGKDFEEGAVGSGTGMRCLGVKGGIGSASRILSFDNRDYTIGCLLMSNFGAAGNLKIEGKSIATRRIDAVSYTHLDVYKRQRCNQTMCCHHVCG